ncbi:MAG TPA: FAD-dependent oxidoreductase [Chitinophagaceae bacterium]|jgi:D-amino-acid dehydrogenase|nr:FAD-dependent oxidoreductase [Chitinophagaceae bacterium]
MKAIVIGGGIIGLSTAYYLQQDGWAVTLVDKTDLSDSCSYGNLGMVVPSHFVPLAAPGMVAQGIRWMFDRKSPFFVRPSLSPELLSWGLKFMKSATPAHVERSAPYLLQLNRYSKALFRDLAETPGFDFAFEEKGILMYYKTEKVAEEEAHLAEKAKSFGLEVDVLGPREAQALEPETELDVLGAVHYRCDAHLYPNKLVPQLIAALRAAGVTFRTGSAVERLVAEGGRIRQVVTGEGALEGDLVVLAAGAHLPHLARAAGLSLPLMPGKGYSFTQEEPEARLQVPAILCEARVAITPMNGFMRFGGTMEIAPVNKGVNMNRVAGIVNAIPRYFPGMKPELPPPEKVWYGFRPCTPDGLPYIGRTPKLDNLYIGGGHAMMGLSLGPATGKVIADLAAGRRPEVALDAFRPDRFS